MELHEIFLNGAYATLLASLVVRDLLRLRLLMTFATLCFIAFAILTDNTPMKLWNFMFTGINVGQAARIIYARRTISPPPEFEEIYENRSANVNKRKLLKNWSFDRNSQDMRSSSQARA